MSSYKGKVVLAVNVASQCGFTKQYKASSSKHHLSNSHQQEGQRIPMPMPAMCIEYPYCHVQELGELYSKYQKKGLVILGFPCNQFNGQEPGDNKQIKAFAKSRGADFPMMSKIEVNGAKGNIVS